MAISRSYLLTLLLYISAVSELRLPQVTCQDEEGRHCIRGSVYQALMRLPEFQDLGGPNVPEDAKLTEVCLRNSVYLRLLIYPAVRQILSVLDTLDKIPNFERNVLNDPMDNQPEIYLQEKRSLATLAKNDDLPITVQDRDEDQDGEEKRSTATSEHLSPMMRQLLEEESRRSAQASLRDYLVPNGEFDWDSLEQVYIPAKRNVGTLARDFALPNGRRNVGSVARDFGLPSDGKRNIGTLARDRMLPSSSGKRNVAALARDYALPYGKRYLASLARTGDLPHPTNKRGVAALARNSDFPSVSKRGISAPAGMIYRTLNRHQASPRSLIANTAALEAVNKSHGKDESGQRSRRQADFSEEYPLPVAQNGNLLDYEDMLEAFAEEYPNAEKRFMGLDSRASGQTDVEQFGYPEVFQENKRHIGSLARSGWLPKFRAVRVLRSPRYIIARENSSNGSAANNTPHPTTRTLERNFHPGARHFQALHQYYQHSFPPKPRERKLKSYHPQMLFNPPKAHKSRFQAPIPFLFRINPRPILAPRISRS